MRQPYLWILVLLVFSANTAKAMASNGWQSEASLETYYFKDKSLAADYQTSVGLTAELSYYHENVSEGTIRSFKAYGYANSQESSRNHLDIRELSFLKVEDGFEWLAGIYVDNWGVTEIHHLVDIVNQTDNLAGFDGEGKLGQPMVKLTLGLPLGSVEIYSLLGFREREFLEPVDRLSGGWKIEESRAGYESGRTDKRVDVAVRWSMELDNVDLSLSHFSGTSREPRLLPCAADALCPYYPVVDQTGLEVQYIFGAFNFKSEVISSSGLDGRYNGYAAGVEYTLPRIGASYSDVGVLVEYYYDTRSRIDKAAYGDDVGLALRWSLNDGYSSQLLGGIVFDTKTDDRILFIEANRRLGPALSLELEMRLFRSANDRHSKLTGLADDSFLRVQATYYY